MTFKEKIINAIGERYKESDDILIEQLENYYNIYNETWKNIKEEKYRIPVAVIPDGAKLPNNARYHLNIAFTTMGECAKHIRAILEDLGLNVKGKKIELTTNAVTKKSLVDYVTNKYN